MTPADLHKITGLRPIDAPGSLDSYTRLLAVGLQGPQVADEHRHRQTEGTEKEAENLLVVAVKCQRQVESAL